jgi:hypothetical protein
MENIGVIYWYVILVYFAASCYVFFILVCWMYNEKSGNPADYHLLHFLCKRTLVRFDYLKSFSFVTNFSSKLDSARTN